MGHGRLPTRNWTSWADLRAHVPHLTALALLVNTASAQRRPDTISAASVYLLTR
jgi:hypothetical protein